jgi:hypothetical protein
LGRRGVLSIDAAMKLVSELGDLLIRERLEIEHLKPITSRRTARPIGAARHHR